jgi:hypothetical protein
MRRPKNYGMASEQHLQGRDRRFPPVEVLVLVLLSAAKFYFLPRPGRRDASATRITPSAQCAAAARSRSNAIQLRYWIDYWLLAIGYMAT